MHGEGPTHSDHSMAEPRVRWALGYDHAGYELAQIIARHITARGDLVLHFGPIDDQNAVDYGKYCISAARAVVEKKADYGVVLGGSGQGEQIAANKVRGIRAALCVNAEYAMLARRDNDANVVALPARKIDPAVAIEIIDIWTVTEFAGGRHARRIKVIGDYEDDNLAVPMIEPRTEGEH
jgi:ribose 5-phosphate isomerase B